MIERAANADYDKLHEARPYHDGTFSRWSEERDKKHPFHYRDGVTITAVDVDLTPDDKFLTDENAKAVDDGCAS